MAWTKCFLIVSLIIFFIALTYSVVSFYQLHLHPEPELIEESDIVFRPKPPVLKIPNKSSESYSETAGEIVVTDDEREWNEDEWDSEDFNLLSTDATIPELLVEAEEKTSKYPPVPEDYPFTPIWLRSETERAQIPQDQLEEQERLSMIMVKLWNKGDHDFTGGVITNGTFYPLYPDVAYVEWEQYQEPDGTIHWYVSSVLTGGGNDSSAIMDQLNNGETPLGIRIVNTN